MAVLMLSALTFSACGDDEEGGNGSQSGQVDKKNKNANVPSAANGYNKAILRIEFPALKQGGKQKVIVYRLTSSLKKHTFYNLLINNILYLCVT